jgi:hypothetical protein
MHRLSIVYLSFDIEIDQHGKDGYVCSLYEMPSTRGAIESSKAALDSSRSR